MIVPFAASSGQGVAEGEGEGGGGGGGGGGGCRLVRGRCASRTPKLARLTVEGGHNNAASCNTSATTNKFLLRTRTPHCGKSHAQKAVGESKR